MRAPVDLARRPARPRRAGGADRARRRARLQQQRAGASRLGARHAGRRSLRADQSAAHAVAGAASRALSRRALPLLPEERVPARAITRACAGVAPDEVVDGRARTARAGDRAAQPAVASLAGAATHEHTGNQCRLSRQRGGARRRRRRHRRRRGRALHARQARQAPGAVLDLGAAVRRDRLLPERRPASRSPTSITSPTPTIRRALRRHADRRERRRSRCRCDPSARRRSRPWQIAVGSALPALHRQRAARSCSTARRIICSSASRGAIAPAAVSLALRRSSSLRTRRAPSSPRRSTHCAVLTMDGRGEGVTTSLRRSSATARYRALGRSNCRIRSACSTKQSPTHLGFLHSSDEYKVMALASFGKPRLRR